MASQRRISGLVILTDKTECPGCRKPLPGSPKVCPRCQTYLFDTTDDFPKIYADGITAFWVWFPLESAGVRRGWVHSDHLEKPHPVEDTRFVEAKPMKPSTGRKSANVRFLPHQEYAHG